MQLANFVWGALVAPGSGRGQAVRVRFCHFDSMAVQRPERDQNRNGNMTAQPQICIISPFIIDTEVFPDALVRVLDGAEIACVRLALASQNKDDWSRAADTLRDLCHVRDIAIVVQDHLVLAQRAGLDGVHFGDASKPVGRARKVLGKDGIVGIFCGNSRHDGITAGEAGVDYVSFGPVSERVLTDAGIAGPELFQWWREMIELPVVAEGGLTPTRVAELASVTDFFGIGAEIWSSDDPLTTLRELCQAMS